MQAPDDDDSPQNIVNALNDDCLLQIFSELSLCDLCDVANVCTRFNDIAMRIFRSKFKNTDDHIESLVREPRFLTPLPLFRIELFFKTFGPEISTMKFVMTDESLPATDILLGFCADFCTNIASLEIAEFYSNNLASCKSSLRRLLPRLTELTLPWFKSPDKFEMDDLLVGDWPLKVLNLNIDEFDWTKTVVKLPQLENLAIIGGKTPTKRIFQQLLGENQQIRCIQLIRFKTNSHVLKLLPEYSPNLREIITNHCSFEEDVNDRFIDWSNLKSLEYVGLGAIDAASAEMLFECEE